MALIGSKNVRSAKMAPLTNGNYVLLGIVPHLLIVEDEKVFLNLPLLGRLDPTNKKIVSVHKVWRSDLMVRQTPLFSDKGEEFNATGQVAELLTTLWEEGVGSHEIVGWLDDILPAVRKKVIKINRTGFRYICSDGRAIKRFVYDLSEAVDGRNRKLSWTEPSREAKDAILDLAKKLTPKGVSFYLDGLDWSKSAKDYQHVDVEGNTLQLNDDGTFAEEGEE